MITIKSASDIRKMQESGRIVEETLQLLSEHVKPGVTTAELNRIAEAHIRSRGAEPSFLGYSGYPASVCISINEEVVHGIPGHRRIREGDMVSCDVGAVKDGFHGAVHDLGRGRAVGVNEPVPLVSFVVALHIAVPQGQLDSSFIGFLAAKLGDAVLNGGFDCIVDRVYRFGITLGD